MAIKLKPNEVLTPPCRLAFASLFKMTPKHPTTPEKKAFQATILIPPGSDMQPFVDAIKAASVEKWSKMIPLEGRGMPLKAGNGQWTGFDKGWFFFKAQSQFMPQVVDQMKREVYKAGPHSTPDEQERARIAAEAIVYSGCWCRFLVSTFAWDNASGRGVSFNLSLVQKIRDDAPFSGRKNADEVFDTVEMDADAPVAPAAAAPAGKPAPGNDPLTALLGGAPPAAKPADDPLSRLFG